MDIMVRPDYNIMCGTLPLTFIFAFVILGVWGATTPRYSAPSDTDLVSSQWFSLDVRVHTTMRAGCPALGRKEDG